MDKKTEIFESMPVPKALMALAIPTVLGQLVTMVYSLTDAFFIGRTGNPYMVASVALCFSLQVVMVSLSNLFGIGGGSLISRMLGAKRPEDAKHVSSFSFWAGIFCTFIVSMLLFSMLNKVLLACGATANTVGYAHSFAFWVVVVGGVPTAAGFLIGNFLRSEGYAKEASYGIMGGSILNCILEPIFIFVLKLNVTGAGMATMIASFCSMCYFFVVLAKLGDRSVLSVSPKYIKLPWEDIKKILAIGFPAALQTLLAALSTSIINHLASGYGDIPVASIGINKRIDMVPLSIGNGLSQGMLPLMAYSYAAKDYKRMNEISRAGRIAVLAISVFFVAIYQLIPEQIIGIFITNKETIKQGAILLRIACTVVPFMQMNALLITTFQAMGKGTQSLILSSCRQGIIAIPLLFLMNHLIGLHGLLWTQTISDIITLCISMALYSSVIRQLKRESTSWDKARL
jgi:multidrug efflux pump